MTKRRTIIKGLASVIPVTALSPGRPSNAQENAIASGRDYYRELGLKRFINAAGAYSAYGGARMRPEVVSAMGYATTNKVKIRDLHDAVGARIASLVGSEAAMVTSGATAAIVLGTAACMTKGDESKMRQLPNTEGIPYEVVIQKKHRYTYDRALTVSGAKLVEVETEQDVRNAVNEKTAMMFFLKPTQDGDNISSARYRHLAEELGIPTFCDAATTTPPASNVIDGVNEGFDLICYSGGKGLRGPYSAGLLIGRKDLISFSRRQGAPNDLSIGRGMKVSAEEYLGMLVALETGLQVDDVEEIAWKQTRFNNIMAAISGLTGVTAKTFVSDGHAKELYLDIDWDPNVIRLTRQGFVTAIRNNEPSVEIRLFLFSGGRIQISATVMDEGEDVIVGEIIRRILLAHS